MAPFAGVPLVAGGDIGMTEGQKQRMQKQEDAAILEASQVRRA